MTFENLEIKPMDLFRLVPMVFLNDTTINFYIRILAKYIVSSSKSQDYHFFNTYFFSKLRTESYGIGQSRDMPLAPSNRPTIQQYMDTIYNRLKSVV